MSTTPRIAAIALVAVVSAQGAEPEPWVWSQTGENGVVLQSQALGEQFHGRYTAMAPDGAALMVATFVHNEATALRLPEANLPPPKSQPGRQPIIGAGGIEFGTASLGAFASMSCGQRRCLTALVHDLAGQMTVQDADGVRDAGMSLFPESTPDPVPGAREYLVGVSLVEGVNEVQAEFHYDSEDECQQERTRIGEVLRLKYGECERLYYQHEDWYGQCDARGLPERAVELSTCFSMPDEDFFRMNVSYHYWSAARRDEAWRMNEEFKLRQSRPGVDDL